MKVLQVATSSRRQCGVGLFAEKLQAGLRRDGIEIETAPWVRPGAAVDVILLQHHEELFTKADVFALVDESPAPIVLFAHSEGVRELQWRFHGLVAMCPGIFAPTATPTFVFPHPAWTPPALEDRARLRRDLGLPPERFVVGTSGYLRFERDFTEIVAALLPEVQRNDGFIELVTSPWRLDSPGLLPALEELRRSAPDHFRYQHAFLDERTLNRRLQACDLLWCWTAARSGPYASGAISDHYASGTRLFAADKRQHRHVLGLPNTVRGPNELAPFIDRLLAEVRRGSRERHDPGLVSWERQAPAFAAFLHAVAARGTA